VRLDSAYAHSRLMHPRGTSMTQAEDMEMTEGVVPTAPIAKPRALPKWLLPSLLAQCVLLIGFALVARTLTNELATIRETVKGQGADLAHARQQAEAVGASTVELKGQIEALRQGLVIRATEDVIFLKITILRPDLDPTLARTVAKIVHKYSELYGRDPNLVLAMIAVESRFDPNVVSPMGAVGLMQVMPQWKRVLGIQGELSDPEVSIRYGLQILGFYSEMYQDLETALTAYNRGPGPVDMALMRGQDPRNRYAPRVLEAYERLKRLTTAAGG
jgi:soluble lytic murein transglycosylase-like protein